MTKNEKIKKLLNEIVKKIRLKYKPEKIILFGSYAHGNPTEDSDIDLLIIKNTLKRPVFRGVEVRKIIYDQKRRIPVSPFVLTEKEIKYCLNLGDDFIGEIITKGKILYEKGRIFSSERMV